MAHTPWAWLVVFAVLGAGCGTATPSGADAASSTADASADVSEPDAGSSECTVDEECDDGVACTVDFCEADGRCSYTPNDSLCGDGDLCSGVETCDPAQGCRPGEPLTCDDGVACTVDSCDPATVPFIN